MLPPGQECRDNRPRNVWAQASRQIYERHAGNGPPRVASVRQDPNWSFPACINHLPICALGIRR